MNGQLLGHRLRCQRKTTSDLAFLCSPNGIRTRVATLRERPGASITFAGDTFGLLRPALRPGIGPAYRFPSMDGQKDGQLSNQQWLLANNAPYGSRTGSLWPRWPARRGNEESAPAPGGVDKKSL